MTQKELKDETIHRLLTNPGHTIVKHVSAKGKPVLRIRDKDVNPIMNFSVEVFKWMQKNDLVKQKNAREWIFLPEAYKDYQIKIGNIRKYYAGLKK